MKRKKILSLILSSVILLTGCYGTYVDDNLGIGDTVENINQQSEMVEIESSIIDEYAIAYKEVTFINYYYAQAEEDIVLTKNRIWTSYANENEDTLYAFCAFGGGTVHVEEKEEKECKEDYMVRWQWAASQNAVDKALEMGLMVLPEYEYCGFNNDNLMMHYAGYNEEGWYPFCGQCVIVGTLEQIEALFQETEPIDGDTWELFAAPRPDWLDIMKQVGLTDREMKWVYMDSKIREDEIQAIIGTEPQITLTVPVIMPEENTTETK